MQLSAAAAAASMSFSCYPIKYVIVKFQVQPAATAAWITWSCIYCLRIPEDPSQLKSDVAFSNINSEPCPIPGFKAYLPRKGATKMEMIFF